MYRYDFGDDWRHDVVLVAIEPRVKATKYPRCIAGERVCPPGCFELLHALADPHCPESEELLAWLGTDGPRGRPYDPETFDPARVRFSSAARRVRMLLEDE